MADSIERSLNYSVDQSSINKAKQELDKLKKKELELAESILKSDSATDKQVKALRDVQKEQKALASILNVVDKGLDNQEQQVNALTRAMREYEEEISRVKKSGADFGGDSASFIAGTRGGLSALTGSNLGGLGRGLEGLEGVADLAEFLPQISSQFSALGNVMRATGGVTGKAVTGIGDMISGVTGLSAGTASFAAVALPVVATLGALAYATHEYNKTAEAQKQIVASLSDALIDTNRRVAEGMTSDDIRAAIAETEALRDADLKSLEFFNDRYADLLASIPAELEGTIFQPFSKAVQGFVQLTNGVEQDLVDSIKELETSTTDYDATLQILNQALDTSEVAANDAAMAEERLADEREQATRQAEQAMARVSQLQAQYADIVESTAIANSNAAEIEAAQAIINNENAQRQEKKHQDALEQIRIDGQARIQAIEAELSALPSERLSALRQVEMEGNKDLDKLRKEYQQSTLEKYQDFSDRLNQTTTDAGESIRRLARDIKASLTDATLENDVAAFLKAQRDGETRLQDARKDASTQQQRMVDEFLKAQERERQAYMEKQDAIQQAIADEQRQVMDVYNERRMALEAQIEQEKRATQERLETEARRHQEQLENDRIRAEQQGRIDEIRERHQQQALERRLQEIQQVQAAETVKYNMELTKIQQVSAAIASIRIPSATQQPVFGGRDSGRPSSGGGSNIFAKFNNVFNNAIGDIASTAEVERALNENNDKLMGGLNAAAQELRSGRNSYA